MKLLTQHYMQTKKAQQAIKGPWIWPTSSATLSNKQQSRAISLSPSHELPPATGSQQLFAGYRTAS